MKIAFLSDIHSNLQALQAVFDDLNVQSIDKMICLGDVVGWGANPKECLAMLFSDKRAEVFLRGNHEHILSRYCRFWEKPPEGTMNKYAWKAIQYSYLNLPADDVERLVQWPERLVCFEEDLTLAHGAYSENCVSHYVDDLAEASFEMDLALTNICVFGHTHKPHVYVRHKKTFSSLSASEIELLPADKYLINVGSVGQPRDGDNRAAYGILEITPQGNVYCLRRVKYDILRAVESFAATNLPNFLANRLFIGE